MDKIKSRRSTVMSPLYGGEKRALRAGQLKLHNNTIINNSITNSTIPVISCNNSIIVIGIVRTIIVKDNSSDALTITTTTTNNNMIVRTKD